MTIAYASTNLLKWGTGLTRRLHKEEVDNNFWELVERIVTLETLPGQPAAIDHFERIGTSFYVHLTDAAVLGPYTLPVWTPTPRGAWVGPGEIYAVGDWFTINGSLYQVVTAHTSASSFDENATDGLGHDLYMLIFSTPGNALPTGGAIGQVIVKTAAPNFSVAWGWKTPTGGTAGQYHRKINSTQDNSEWSFIQADEVEFTPATGSPLTSDNLADVIEELAAGGIVDASDVPYTAPTGSGRSATNVADAIDEVAGASSAGRQTLWIPAGAMTPLLTDGAAVGLFETAVRKNVIKTLDFDPDGYEGAQFEIAMPKSWDLGPISFRLYWSHATAVTSFGTSWDIYAEAFNPGSDFDSNINNAVSVADTGGLEESLFISDETDPLDIVEAFFATTITSNDNLLFFRINRDGSNGADSLLVDARLHGIQVFYDTSTGTDD